MKEAIGPQSLLLLLSTSSVTTRQGDGIIVVIQRGNLESWKNESLFTPPTAGHITQNKLLSLLSL